jgi:hypothetical protein
MKTGIYVKKFMDNHTSALRIVAYFLFLFFKF